MQVLPHRDILRYEEIERIVAVAVPLGISHIRITGGEPLVRRGVVDFIASLAVFNGIEDISLTTNGVLLAEMAAGLRKAGVRRLNISLDSLDAGEVQEDHRRATVARGLAGDRTGRGNRVRADQDQHGAGQGRQ